MTEEQRAKRKASNAKWLTTHREEARCKMAKWRKAHPKRSKAIQTKYYVNNYDSLIARNAKNRRNQKELKAGRPRPAACEACGRVGPVCFDHCHKSKKFRGWLCAKCNLCLGHADDSPEVLRKLAKYLTASK